MARDTSVGWTAVDEGDGDPEGFAGVARVGGESLQATRTTAIAVTAPQRVEIGRRRNVVADIFINRDTTKLPHPLQHLLEAFTHDEGQGMVEYALILVLIAVVVTVVLIILGNQVQNVFCNISGGLGM